LFAAYKELRRELSRRRGDSALALSLPEIDGAIDEAIAVLARQAETLGDAIKVGVRGLISRPAIFNAAIPRYWVATEPAHRHLKTAALAAIRGEDDTPYADAALAHYRSFSEDAGDETAPDGNDVYVEALDYILRSLRRDLSLGEQVILTAIDGIRQEIERHRPPETGDLADARIRERIERLRQTRFFRSAEPQKTVRQLIAEIVEGPLRSASADWRSRALAWGARLMVFADIEVARRYLDMALALGIESEEVRVAQAFVASADGEVQDGLRQLAPRHSGFEATAAFQIVRAKDGSARALAWANDVGFGGDAFASDGRYAVLTALVDCQRWTEALELIDRLEPMDYDATPVLLWISATVLVASTLPPDLQAIVIHDVPNNASAFPMGDDARSIDRRRSARDLMERCAVRCAALDLRREAVAARRYALWLDLRDPDRRKAAHGDLLARLDDPGEELAWFPMALSFGLPVDRDKAERSITTSLALDPEPSPEAVTALISLLIDHGLRDPVRAAEFLARHRTLLAQVIEPESFVSLQVRILVDIGRPEEARAIVDQAVALSDTTRQLLISTIGDKEGEASIEALEAAYKADPQTHLLILMLQRYARAGVSRRYLEIARHLLSDVANVGLASDVVHFLRANDHDREALDLLELIGDAVRHSDNLLANAAWLYFRQGRLTDAEAALAILEQRRDDQGDRALRYQLIVASGRWDDLDALLEQQWQRREARAGDELVQCAKMAAHLGGRRVADFLRAAIAKAPDDPGVLIAAYFAATIAGIEETLDEAGGWMVKAADLSGEEGPVQRKSIEALLEEKPAWDQQVEKANRTLAEGSAPIAVTAAMVRRSWLDLHLAPLVTNPAVRDVRRRSLVAPFSGRRRIAPGDTIREQSASFDRTSIVTLAAIGLLDDVLATFDAIHVPHDILSDLFEERARLTFHQPSRIAFARRLIELVATGAVREFEPTTVPALNLVPEIGVSLSALLTEAATHKDEQHVLVHPFPITRVGSFRNDAVPLDGYGAHLCSCSAIVDALERASRIGRNVARTAHAYLGLQEQRWPDEPKIARGATLYLSDLSVSHLRHVGLLDRIAEAGLTVVVSKSELDEARALIELDNRSSGVDALVERVRASLADGLAAGRVVLTPLPSADGDADGFIEVLTNLANASATFVCDDRFLNQHADIDIGGGPVRIVSSLDLIDLLAAGDRLPIEKTLEARTILREAGVIFVPASAAELAGLVADTGMASARGDEGETFQETAELRAFRENIRLAQSRGWFNPQIDTMWMFDLHAAIDDAIAKQWTVDIPDALARARSTWLARLVDSRDWTDTAGMREMGDLSRLGILLDLVRLVNAGNDVSEAERPRFDAWLEEHVFEPLWLEQPRLRPLFANHMQGMVSNVARELAAERPEIGFETFARLSFDRLPEFIQTDMLADPAFQEQVAYSLSGFATIGGVTFSRERLGEVTAQLYADPAREIPVEDVDGNGWSASTDAAVPLWPLRLHRDEQRWQVRGMVGLHPTADQRLAMLDAVLEERGIASVAFASWRDLLAERSLSLAEIDRFDAELRLYPPVVEEMILDTLEVNRAEISTLVPGDAGYYEHLVGGSEATTLPVFLAEPHGDRLDWVRGGARLRAHWELLLAARPGIAGAALQDLTTDEWHELGAQLVDIGDPLAKVGFVELALPRVLDDPKLEGIVMTLTRQIEALDPADLAGPLHLLSCLTIFVDGELSLRETLADWPPFRRRLAALAQASMIVRVVQNQIETKRFANFCAQQRGWRFHAQNLVDMRREPRWRPELIGADQLYHELVGRIFNAAFALPQDRRTPAIEANLLDEKRGLRARIVVPNIFWPGPIEGGREVELQVAATDICASLEQALATEPLGVDALNQLITISSMFKLPEGVVDRAVERIRDAGPRIVASIDPGRIRLYLLGLASVAAAERQPLLAETVGLFARFNRLRAPLSIQDEMQLALHAAAAHEDQGEWRRFVGDWTFDLSERLDVDDLEQADRLMIWIETLCSIDPYFRATTGRALANTRLILCR